MERKRNHFCSLPNVMTLLLIVIPAAIILISSIVAHSSTQRFWLACTNVMLFTTVTYFLYVLVLSSFNFDFELRVLLSSTVASIVAGVIAFFCTVIVGVPFLLDRRIQKRQELHGERD